MSEPNLAKAQSLVVAWCFLLPSYSLRLSRHHTRQHLLTASYLLSSLPLAPSLTSYSPRPTRYRSRRRWRAQRHPPHSCRTHRVVLNESYSSSRAHRVVLIASCSSRRAHRVVLNASCHICQLSFVSARSVVVAYIDVH